MNTTDMVDMSGKLSQNMEALRENADNLRRAVEHFNV